MLFSDRYDVKNLTVKVLLGKKSFIISLVYLPTITTLMNNRSNTEAFCHFTQSFSKNCMDLDTDDNTLLLEDFSFPGYSWTEDGGILCTSDFIASIVIRGLLDILVDLE